MKKSILNIGYGKILALIIILAIISFFGSKLYKESDNVKAEVTRIENPLVNQAPLLAKEEPTVSISPKKILQGDPVLITINSTTTPMEILWDTKKIPIFTYDGKPRGLFGVDFNEKVLNHEVKVKFPDGKILTTAVAITPREKIEKTLGIPEKLGGNTTEASKALVANLSRENAVLNNISTEAKQTWTNKFLSPLTTLFVTDTYGYDRKTIGQTIVHKGTDFRAPVGTEVKAMNKGIVKIARTFIVYGNAIIIDHGLGLNTSYMHLSKMNVKEGDIVESGQVIGLSGNTGYVEAAHLHISVKINAVSVDPMTFMELL